jgi:hemolysin activation/secretion protein
MASVGTTNKALAFLVSVTLPIWVGISVGIAAPAVSSPPPSAGPSQASGGPAPSGPVHKMFIREFRVTGSKILSPEQVGDIVYPFLGPDRTTDGPDGDVEKARAALEKAYHDKGYNTVQVEVPPQQGRGGVVFLQVDELKVGRLRVKGSRYFSLDNIRHTLPALAPGTVPNFNDLKPQLSAVNQWPDRTVLINAGALRPGVEPGTVDIDLTVKDSNPLHGSFEFNNRQTPDTDPFRLNGSISYDNLWQLGHGVGFSFQVAPQDPNEVKVFSGYYLARLPNVPWLTLTLQGTDQNSNVSTLSDSAVAGKGYTIGLRAGISLPPMTDYVHSLTVGLDYKHFDQATTLAAGTPTSAVNDTPVTYYPLSFVYSGTWLQREKDHPERAGHNPTTLDAGIYLSLREASSADVAFDNLRYLAQSNFIYFRGDISHEHDLPGDFQLWGKIQGQLSDQSLISGEQFIAGGLSTVRGYLEGEIPGDNGLAGSVELRSPSLLSWINQKPGEWRVYGFFDAAYVNINNPLPQQTAYWTLASIGAGTRLNLFDHLHSSLDAGCPLTTETETIAHHWQFTFRVWGDF